MPPSKIAPKTRAAAIADLMDGAQPADVAKKYGIDAGKVRMWKTRYVAPHVAESITPTATVIHRPAIEAQQLEIGELIMASLKAKIFATQRIAEHATAQSWLEKQDAADVATLFAAIDSAAVAILDRMAQRSHASADDSRAAPGDDSGGLSGGDEP